MKSIKFLQPNLAKILFLILSLIMISLTAIDYQETSKVSWQENRGIPLSFITISGYKGPCHKDDLCRNIDIQNINLYSLIVDIAVWYLVSCAAVSGFWIVKTRDKARKLV